MGEALLITPHAPARFFGLHLRDRRLRHADHQPPKHPQDQRRVGVAHPTAILIERHVQRVMQSALNDPITALEFDPARRVQSLRRQTADQIHRLGALFSVAPHPPLEPRNQSRAGKTRLFGRHLPTFQEPNLTPAPIDFPRQCPRLGRGPRGKISPGPGASPGCGPVPFGSL